MILAEALLLGFVLAVLAWRSWRTAKGLPLLALAGVIALGAAFDATGYGDKPEAPLGFGCALLLAVMGLALPRLRSR